MIIVAGTVKIRAGVRDEALAVGRVMEQSTAQEAGCITYRFYADPHDDTLLFVFEAWDDAESLSRHFQTPHMAAFNQALPHYLADVPTIKRYQVTSVTEM